MSLLTKHDACAGTGCSSRACIRLHVLSVNTVRQAQSPRTQNVEARYNVPVQRNAVLARSGLSTEPELQAPPAQLSSNTVSFQDHQHQQQELLLSGAQDNKYVVQQHGAAPASLAASTSTTSAVDQIGTEHALHATAPTAEEGQEVSAPDAATAGVTDAAADAPASNSSSSTPRPGGFYSYYSRDVYDHPVPVQLPPQGATTDPPAQLPFFVKAKYKSPAFLKLFPVREGEAYNYLSFLGPPDWHGGKYYVRHNALENFLRPYWKVTVLKKRRMHIAESYQGQPYKFFQELDFAWSLDVNLVLQLIPKVVQIVTEEACRAHRVPEPHPTPIISMRTPYKVHLNFPDIFTVEATVRAVRKRVINRCRQELSGLPPLQLLKEEQQLHQQVVKAQQAVQQLPESLQEAVMQKWRMSEGSAAQLLLSQLQLLGTAAGSSDADTGSLQEAGAAAAAAVISPQQQQLDWESIIDSPHGSLRLLGSCKAPWMDSDPAWVTEKCYNRVELVDGVWMRQPLSFAGLMECSILLTALELRVFEQSEEFLEGSYQAVDSREQMLAAKRLIRFCNRELQRFQQLQKQQDGGSAAAAAAMAAAAVNTDLMPWQQQENTLKRKLSKEERRLLQQQQQAAQEQQRQRKKEAALAKLREAAAASTAQQQQQHRAGVQLVRPVAVNPSLGMAAARPGQQLQQQQ